MPKNLYNEKAKERTMRYLEKSRDKLNLNLPKGDKERYKEHAKSLGKSLTELIVELLEEHIKSTEEHRKELERMNLTDEEWRNLWLEIKQGCKEYAHEEAKMFTESE